jgi:guanine nucleotide-binding protein G(i) subunit alpha
MLGNSQQEETPILRLLLLGTGESGKSTIFKQMQILYQQGFADFERHNFRQILRRNLVESMQTLIMGINKFGLSLSPEARPAAEAIMNIDPLESEFWLQEIIGNINLLWHSEENIKITYQNRNKLQLLDSAAYLFENIERIGAVDYFPSQQDILRARLRTSGIVERIIPVEGTLFKFIDVGGQRNERRKWIHCNKTPKLAELPSAIPVSPQFTHNSPRCFAIFPEII